MATTYYVNSGAGGADTGGSWTDAFLTLAQGVAAATSDNDVVKVHYEHVQSAYTGVTAVANIAVISVDKDASDALTPMGSSGRFTNNQSYVTIGGAFRVFIYGLTFQLTGTNVRYIACAGDNGHVVYQDPFFDVGPNTALSSGVYLAPFSNDQQSYVELHNPTFKFGAANQRIFPSRADIYGGTIDAAGTAPGAIGLFDFSRTDPGGAYLVANGFNITHMNATTPTLVTDSTTQTFLVKLINCKLPAGLTYFATQTAQNQAAGEVWLHDCAVGDTHGLFAYANPQGSVVSDTGIYFTAGAAGQSWKIVTTANCNYYTPFETPWFGYYNSDISTAIAPYIEILRDGSATEYQDDEVWIDVLAKVTSGSTQSTLYTDRMILLGSDNAQDNGAGLGSWTGESGTAWSGKIGLGSTITPAEVGHIQARIVVGEPSVTVYADPQLRT